MTILTILMAIVNAALFFLYGKEHKRRIALEGEVKSFADRKAYELNKLLEDIQIKPKAMTAPIDKSRYCTLHNDGTKESTIITPDGNKHQLKPGESKDVLMENMTAPIVKKDAEIKHSVKLVNGPTKVILLPKIPRGYKRNNGLKKWKLNPTDIIDILFRDGKIWKEETVRGWDWKHQYGGSDIIAYKVVKPKTMKRKKT